ncbi:MAG: hypothetical protein IJR27_05615 [Synergistaceae bacterium]|nr:hypothetical protein [Synergistaceae bacterium]
MKKVTPPSRLSFCFFVVIVLALFAGVKADAMPEGQGLIARYYPGWEAILRKESDFFKFTRDFMSDYECYSEQYRVKIQQEIQEVFHNAASFDQEQAEKEIGQLIDSKKLPNYLLDKGQYKYDGNVNSVYFLNEFKLRSQPNTEARVISEEYGGHQDNYFAISAYNYLGEWTHPNGSEWIIIKADVFQTDTTEIGFVTKKEANFVTNEQLKSFVNALEILAVAGEAALLEKQALESQYTAEIDELQQQLQTTYQQAQQTQRQVQQAQQQVYQCQKCGKRVVTSSAANLPNDSCGLSLLAPPHMWRRLQ